MARPPNRFDETPSPRKKRADAGWTLHPIIATPPGRRVLSRGVGVYALFGEVSCLTGCSTASHFPVRPVAFPAVTVACSPSTTGGTSSVRLFATAGVAVFTAG